MKIAFSFFLLIYLRCGAPASWAARHTIVYLGLLCGVPYLGDNYNAKVACFGEGAMELCTNEKAVFFLPVNILTVWSPAFLAA